MPRTLAREISRIRPATADGLQCDRCGANVAAELRACRIEGKGLTRDGPLPEMRLCVPCIGALEAIGAQVHVRLTATELRAQLHVFRPGRAPPPAIEPPTVHAPDLSRYAANRAPSILLGVAQQAIELALDRSINTARDHRALAMLGAAIEHRCDLIERAAKSMPAVERNREKEAARKAESRQALAAELRGARAKLRKLNRALAIGEQRLIDCHKQLAPPHQRAELAAQMVRARARLNGLRRTFAEESAAWGAKHVCTDPAAYPNVPPGTIAPADDGAGLPETSGIYFLWADGVVEYVGQSTKLCNRVKRGHDRLRNDHLISFVPVEPRHLNWAECWYIGILRPKLNFGRNASHNKYE